MKRSPLRRVSKKQAALLRQYSKLRKEYLAKHPWCEARVACNPPVRAVQIHHKQRRGANLLKTETWLACCEACHQWITDRPREAKAKGLDRS
jgi:hypothetical protein